MSAHSGWTTPLAALLGALLAAALLAAIWSSDEVVQSRVAAYGQSLAQTLSMQVTDPLLKSDNVSLGVLVNRSADLPDVHQAELYDVTNQLLAASAADPATKAGATYSEPIVVEDTMMGFARVTLTANAMATPVTLWRVLGSLIAVVSGPALLLLWHTLRRSRRPVPIVTLSEPPARRRSMHLLVVATLYDPLTYSRDRRLALHAGAQQFAEKIGRLYHGAAAEVGGRTVILDFAEETAPDQALRALCAALLWRDVLQAAYADAEFRIALHRTALTEGQRPPADLVADASLLAALALPKHVIASDAFASALPEPPDAAWRRDSQAMLSDIAIVEEAAYHISTLASPHQQLIARQAAILLDNYRGDTLNRSAF